jgi:hypothetical protein
MAGRVPARRGQHFINTFLFFYHFRRHLSSARAFLSFTRLDTSIVFGYDSIAAQLQTRYTVGFFDALIGHHTLATLKKLAKIISIL